MLGKFFEKKRNGNVDAHSRYLKNARMEWALARTRNIQRRQKKNNRSGWPYVDALGGVGQFGLGQAVGEDGGMVCSVACAR